MGPCSNLQVWDVDTSPLLFCRGFCSVVWGFFFNFIIYVFERVTECMSEGRGRWRERQIPQ